MPRQPRNPVSRDAEVDQFLAGRFLETMRLYGEMAGTTNPAIRAADALQAGQAVEVPGEWIGPEYGGLTFRLQKGRPAEVADDE